MDKHEAYSVLITDNNGRRGTGTLFYEGGSAHFYILTCAHVIYGATEAQISILVDAGDDDPKEYVTVVSNDHFHYSPVDEVTQINAYESQHSCDIAVIECDVGGIPLCATQYAMYPMTKREMVTAVGYPQSMSGQPLYYQQDRLRGQVEKILENQNYFLIRVTDDFLNAADRAEELNGFSGSPVWDDEKLEDGCCLFGGLIAFGDGSHISRARVNVVNARLIQSLMREKFHVTIETKLPMIPDKDVAPGYEAAEADNEDKKAVRDSWIEHERSKGQTYVDNLKLRQAIKTCKEAIHNAEFQKCSTGQKYSLYAVMLEAYRLARDYDTYDRIVDEMHRAGITSDRENLITAVRHFEAFELDQAEKYIKKALALNPTGNEERVFDLAIQAFRNEAADLSILSSVMGSRDQLLIKPKDPREEESIYQILGFVLEYRFKETGRAIRCINRAFQISGNYIILETLATLYYIYSIRNAAIEKGADRIDPLKIDAAEIEKARDAYLRVLSAADELYLSGMIKRTGLQMFKCFFFLRDNFRIYKHYHDLMKYFDFPEPEVLRDVQLCYLQVAIEKETVDLSEYEGLTEHDRHFYELVILLKAPMAQFNGGILVPARISEGELRELLAEAESRLRELVKTQTDDRLNFDGIRTTLINLYGNGILRYNWQAISEVKRHYSQLKNPDAAEFLELYVDELESINFSESEQRYKAFFEKRRDVLSFNEWCHFYTRHGRIDKTRELYESVFNERHFLIENQAEYFYRSYIMFIMEHGYDLTSAIRCYVEHKNEIKDIFLRLLFEMDLHFAVGTFNDPELMLATAKELRDEGLLSEEEYNRRCLIINMLNCRPEEAERFVAAEHIQNPLLANMYERLLLVWKGIRVNPDPHWESMQKWGYEELLWKYAQETWVQPADTVLDRFGVSKRKTVVADLWMIYFLVKSKLQRILGCFEKIYITHNTVSMALQEINSVNDENVRRVLTHLLQEPNIIIKSPTLAEQLETRDPSFSYMEIHSALLLAEILDCPALVGEFRFPIPGRFHARVIRPDKIIDVKQYMEGLPVQDVDNP